MSHRASRTPAASLTSLDARASRYIQADRTPVGRALRWMIVSAMINFAIGLGLTLLGCVLSVIDPTWLFSMMGIGLIVALGLGLTLLCLACFAGKRIWQHGTDLNRFSIIFAPIAAFWLVWSNRDTVLNATDAFGGALYGKSGLYATDGNTFVALLLTLFLQCLVWAIMFALPVLAMSGLGANRSRLNSEPHRLTDATVGQKQSVFWHLVCGYGATFLALCAWFPFFAAAF